MHFVTLVRFAKYRIVIYYTFCSISFKNTIKSLIFKMHPNPRTKNVKYCRLLFLRYGRHQFSFSFILSSFILYLVIFFFYYLKENIGPFTLVSTSEVAFVLMSQPKKDLLFLKSERDLTHPVDRHKHRE